MRKIDIPDFDMETLQALPDTCRPLFVQLRRTLIDVVDELNYQKERSIQVEEELRSNYGILISQRPREDDMPNNITK